MKELKLRKCLKCGKIVKILDDGKCPDCNIICCGQDMVEIKVNSVDASFEKHVPTYEIIDENMKVMVNHVMDEDHYIEWILVMTENGNYEKEFKPGDKPELTVPYSKGSVLYAYCNKHGLWKNVVE